MGGNKEYECTKIHLGMQPFEQPRIERSGPSSKIVVRCCQTVEACTVTVEQILNASQV